MRRQELRSLSEETKVYRNKIRLENPRNVQRLLARTINLLNDGEISEGRAKAIGYLTGILIKSFETIDFETRLKELEKQVIDKK
jgi:hypothetical protein